jgi:hypothetical protein
MFNLQNRLLTRYPLLWNTRIVWVGSALVLIHLLFFLAGFIDFGAASFKANYSLSSIISAGMVTFSILCSLVLLVCWLVFYLRNNAYKKFYIIDKYHLSKEFFIITLVLVFAINFFESYKWGGWLKARTITSKQQLVKEANTVNLAMAFVPTSKSAYFSLVNCNEDDPGRDIQYLENHDYFDSTAYDYNNMNNVIVRRALKNKDAFSYKNYCNEFISLKGYDGFIPAKEWKKTKDRWIDNHETDSIKYILRQWMAVCNKYQVDQKLDIDELASLVFSDPNYNVTKVFPSNQYNYSTSAYYPNYFQSSDLEWALHFADSCQLGGWHRSDDLEVFTVELYVALCLSILLFSYRLFSRKTFLISTIGSIVWTILVILIGVSSELEGILWTCLLLSASFLGIALLMMRIQSSKALIGALLNWHIYLAPFIIMFITILIETNFEKKHGWFNNDEYVKQTYPVAYWIDHHIGLIFRLNLLLVFLYVTFFFTRLSKKWHIMPEE